MEDILLQSDKFAFSIDEIFLNNIEKNIFSARIIPHINSNFFPPAHTRTINLTTELLTKEFYNSVIRKIIDFPIQENIDFTESVVQGGYYIIPKKQLPEKVFKPETVIAKENDFFINNKAESPFSEKRVVRDIVLGTQDIEKITSDSGKAENKKLYLYCLNVGQGDSFIIVFPNRNVYIVDTNFYANTIGSYIKRIKEILIAHELPENDIKALIVSHKHLDHLRGAKYLIEEYSIENFLINHDYIHSTKPVLDLLEAAQKIPNWFNINSKAKYNEGDVEISINNPDSDTYNNNLSPDINDSSIILTLKYRENIIYLTGDAGHTIINKKINQAVNNQNILKVSHHGSYTGTNQQVINNLNPSHNFISAGWSRKYNHPDNSVLNLLNTHTANTFVSKMIKRDIEFTCDGFIIQYAFM